jgi:hypothetical protein
MVRVACDLGEDELHGTAECGGASGACAFRRRHTMDTASFEAFCGDYQLAPGRVLFFCGGNEWGNSSPKTRALSRQGR